MGTLHPVLGDDGLVATVLWLGVGGSSILGTCGLLLAQARLGWQPERTSGASKGNLRARSWGQGSDGLGYMGPGLEASYKLFLLRQGTSVGLSFLIRKMGITILPCPSDCYSMPCLAQDSCSVNGSYVTVISMVFLHGFSQFLPPSRSFPDVSS